MDERDISTDSSPSTILIGNMREKINQLDAGNLRMLNQEQGGQSLYYCVIVSPQ